jgi:iron complex outermembrane recepter protein
MSHSLPLARAGSSRERRARSRVGIVLRLALVVSCAVARNAQASSTVDTFELSLEDLMNIQVTSVSKKEQNLSKTAAAISIITAEDIRHSGATTIPDPLRMAPGVHVAQMDANTWAISIRGFTDRYGDKVLVVMDGRSAYTPTRCGVNWTSRTSCWRILSA